MIDQTLASLLSTLFGGLLTITGGIIGSYYIQKISSQAEDRKEIREMAKNIYKDIQAIDTICRAVRNISIDNVDKFSKNTDEITEMNHNIEMIVILFLPTLVEDSAAFSEQISLFMTGATEAIWAHDFNKLKNLPYDSSKFRLSLYQLLEKRGYSYL